jgi:hypothetical protein
MHFSCRGDASVSAVIFFSMMGCRKLYKISVMFSNLRLLVVLLGRNLEEDAADVFLRPRSRAVVAGLAGSGFN